MDIRYSKAVARALARMSAATALRITSKIRQYAADPESLANNVRRLKGSSTLRLRVGDYRVIFTADGVVMAILNIGPRGSMYED